MTVRLAGNVFGTWRCEDGKLRLAYTVDNDGVPRPVSDAELAELATLHTLEGYLLNYRERLADDDA